MTYPKPLSSFHKGQWWMAELDKAASAPDASPNLKRAVAVVRHMLLSASTTNRVVRGGPGETASDYRPPNVDPNGP